jgi:putative acetyltransferase
MHIRKGTINDLGEIITLFQNTVRKVNAKDYTKKEIDVWANATNINNWKKCFENEVFFVAVKNGVIVGFSSIISTGYLNFMYVHHNHQREGIAESLLSQIEAQAFQFKCDKVFASVSITAKEFFLKQNYKVTSIENKLVGGIEFNNSVMTKHIE